jgi:hypothetical protein
VDIEVAPKAAEASQGRERTRPEARPPVYRIDNIRNSWKEISAEESGAALPKGSLQGRRIGDTVSAI